MGDDDKKPWHQDGDNPTTHSWEKWGSAKQSPKLKDGETGTEGQNKVFGLGGSATVVNQPGRHFVDAEAAIGGARLEGAKKWEYGQVGGEMSVLYAKAEGHAGATSGGIGAQGEASAAMLQAKVTGQVGTETANLGGALEHRQFYAEAKGQALLGDDGRYRGVALGGKAGAGVMDGTAGGSVTVPIGWLPFVPDGWTLQAKGEAAGSVGSAEIAGGAYLYHDRADGRFHGGAFEGIGFGLGEFLAMDLSIGPSKPAPPPKPEDFIRPMARVGDPVGAHSSNLGTVLLVAGLVAGALLAWPAVVAAAGVGAAVGLTGVAATAVSGVAVGGAIASGITGMGALANLGASLGKLVSWESGSPCSEILEGSSKTFCEGKAVARIGDKNSHGGAAMLKSGAERVLECGGNVSRVKEKSTCGGTKVLKGASKTFVGTKSVEMAAAGDAKSGLDQVTDWISYYILGDARPKVGPDGKPVLGADGKPETESSFSGQFLKYYGMVGDFISGGAAAKKLLASAATGEVTRATVNAAARSVVSSTTRGPSARVAAAKVALGTADRYAAETFATRGATAATRLFGAKYATAGAVAASGTYSYAKAVGKSYATEKIGEGGTSSLLQYSGVSKENADAYAKGVFALRELTNGRNSAREDIASRSFIGPPTPPAPPSPPAITRAGIARTATIGALGTASIFSPAEAPPGGAPAGGGEGTPARRP